MVIKISDAPLQSALCTTHLLTAGGALLPLMYLDQGQRGCQEAVVQVQEDCSPGPVCGSLAGQVSHQRNFCEFVSYLQVNLTQT